jgi:23S rRNA (cytidine1920-2'-O)/16S rRNA (cytidine1409-2'-O)-methyltransferase
VCREVADWLTGIGWRVDGITPSPITGPEGNVEFLLWAGKPEPQHPEDAQALVPPAPTTQISP